MRITHVEMCGFRGVREPVRLEIPNGFAVITGRNGSGKSTVCDAIEFALTGGVSKHYEGHEKGETFNDYLWWRGAAPPVEPYVSLGLESDDGRRLEVHRTAQGPEFRGDLWGGGGAEELVGLLCDVSYGSRDNLDQLCRTSIVRDETLAAHSVDLEETDRFTFVKAALGTDPTDVLDKNQKALLRVLSQRTKELEMDYLRARNEVASVTTALSEARANAGQAEDVLGATTRLRAFLQSPGSTEAELQVAARRRVAEGRSRIEKVIELGGAASALRRRREAASAPPALATRASLTSQLEAARAAVEDAERKLQELQALAATKRSEAGGRRSLAMLHQAGADVGLRDGTCPLCRSAQSPEAFVEALRRLAAEVEGASQEAARLDVQVESLKTDLGDRRKRAAELERVVAESENEAMAIERAESRILEQARQFGVEVDSRLDTAAFESAARAEADALHEVEVALAVLDVSFALDRVAQLTARLADAQSASEAAEQRVREAKRAEQKAKELYAGIRTSVGEVVDERLASLEPLLKELYARLRPHVDWQEVHYQLRGQVRRFLSLRVGDDINPRFVFSSGQRRAAGLAFLLAVHLSRPWCKLKSLVLDDPIQHVDDFRALHLAEVLASISRGRRQVICTVEDPALADLLSRRLGSREDGEGVMYKLAYAPSQGVRVHKRVEFPAVRGRVLSMAS